MMTADNRIVRRVGSAPVYSNLEIVFTLRAAKYAPLSSSGVDIIKWWTVVFWIAQQAMRPVVLYLMVADSEGLAA